MYVYSLDTPLLDFEKSVELMKLLISMEPIRRRKSFMLVGPYRYPDAGTRVIPESIWKKYHKMVSVERFAGRHWEVEVRKYYEDDLTSFAKRKSFVLKLHEPDFPLDLMMRINPDVRSSLTLIKKT